MQIRLGTKNFVVQWLFTELEAIWSRGEILVRFSKILIRFSDSRENVDNLRYQNFHVTMDSLRDIALFYFQRNLSKIFKNLTKIFRSTSSRLSDPLLVSCKNIEQSWRKSTLELRFFFVKKKRRAMHFSNCSLSAKNCFQFLAPYRAKI